MKHLTKDDNEQRDGHIRSIKEKAEVVREILAKVNAMIFDELNPAIAEYNGAVNEADEWRNELTGRMEDYISERSEKWQEGDSGQSYSSWKDAWENLSLEQAEEISEEIEFQELDTDELEQIASQPED
jgi:hypothetical protein